MTRPSGPQAPARDVGADRPADGGGVRRADVALVQRGLARSRTHAAKLIAAGRVRAGEVVVDRASRPVPDDVAVDVRAATAEDAGGPVTGGDTGHAGPTGGTGEPVRAEVDWVSRGAVKLDRALAAWAHGTPAGPPVDGRRCLDAGASTGGFTEVLLRRGAHEVVAVDVGRDQLAAGLRVDPRVAVHEGTSVRGLDPADVGGPAQLLVADLSFISLRTVLPDLAGLVLPDGDLVVMVKPQFEVGRARLPRGGVVREAGDRVDAVLGVAAAARALGFVTLRAVPSALPGPAGNLEFFLWLARGDGRPAGLGDDELATIVRGAG